MEKKWISKLWRHRVGQEIWSTIQVGLILGRGVLVTLADHSRPYLFEPFGHLPEHGHCE